MLVVLNEKANHGTARKKWLAIEKPLFARLANASIAITRNVAELENAVRFQWESGERQFIAAGGDGSVNCLLNCLTRMVGDGPELKDLTLGAIGLGSSNDFHKPFDRNSFIDRIPVKIDCQNVKYADVGKAVFTTRDTGKITRHFLINGSMGLTATANYKYNHPDPFLAWLKPRFTNVSILYAALSTMFFYRNQPAAIAGYTDGMKQISNINILKNPHFAGSFHYRIPQKLDDGFLTVALCLDMNKKEMLRTMMGLARGRFGGKRHTPGLCPPSAFLPRCSPSRARRRGFPYQ